MRVLQLTDEWVSEQFPSISNVQELRDQLLQGAQIQHMEQVTDLSCNELTNCPSASLLHYAPILCNCHDFTGRCSGCSGCLLYARL